MAHTQHAPVRDAMNRLHALSADEEAKRRAFERERALHDEISLLNGARREGVEEGLEAGRVEGRKEGRMEGRAEQLSRQLQRRFGPLPAAIALRLQRASEADLERWADEVLFADTLAAVFGNEQ